MKIGGDPEVFILNSRGEPVPAHRFFGDKQHKTALKGGIKLFRDGYVVEINMEPAVTVSALAMSMTAALRELRKRLPSSYRISLAPALSIDLRALSDAPEDVRHFGCEPSYDAYTSDEKRCRINAWEHPVRYAGGHMHMSATPAEVAGPFKWLTDRENHLLYIRMLDYWVGAPLTLLFNDLAQYRRREVYGQAGEYRPQQYPDGSVGLEYRTPSPHLWANWPTARVSYERAMHIFRNFELYKRGWDHSMEPLVQRAINTGRGLRELVSSEPLHAFGNDTRFTLGR